RVNGRGRDHRARSRCAGCRGEKTQHDQCPSAGLTHPRRDGARQAGPESHLLERIRGARQPGAPQPSEQLLHAVREEHPADAGPKGEQAQVLHVVHGSPHHAAGAKPGCPVLTRGLRQRSPMATLALALVDRGVALVSMAVAIALGATSMTDITLLAHHGPVLGPEPSDTTVRRTLELADPRTLDKIARARATVRAHVWSLIAARPARFPWLSVAGKLLAGWLVIDLDGTLITARSDKEGAAATFKMGYGFHPLGAWCANTAESLAMLLRAGNAGSNTFADHLTVLTAAIRQIPARMRARLLVRVDGAGASHELISHLLSLSSRRRTVLFTCGWAITEGDEQAIRLLPAAAWQAAVDQDGVVQEDKHVAEITHLMSRAA